jgi:hypothetical protein
MKGTSRALAIAMIATALFGTMAEAQTRSEVVEQRLQRQRQRIERSIRTGRLTRSEARRLIEANRRITAIERRMLRDGQLIARERARLRGLLDRQSYWIWRYSHNRPRALVY